MIKHILKNTQETGQNGCLKRGETGARSLEMHTKHTYIYQLFKEQCEKELEREQLSQHETRCYLKL